MSKYLIDVNLPRRIVAWSGHNFEFVVDINDEWTDSQIWEYGKLKDLTIDVKKTVSPTLSRINVDKQIRSLTGETVMTLYIGVDFHSHQQTVAWCDAATGETQTVDLKHDLGKVRQFYETLPEPAIVGIEASAKATWFEKMLFETGHQLFVGNPVLIRKRATSRHKNDRRDAELILELLLRGEFPAIWRRPPKSSQVIEILGLRQSLVRQRTQCYNRLQALAHSIGMPKVRMKSVAVQAALEAAEMDEADSMKREHLFSLIGQLNGQIDKLNDWLKTKAEGNASAGLLETQKGIGYLTALVAVHTLGDVTRFKKVNKQVVSFAGLDPREDSSAGRIRFGSITKAGSPLLRHHLGQAAMIASRYDPRLKAFYKRLAKKKPKGVAKTAAARKLLVKLAIMLRDNISADEFDRRGRTVGNAR
jgi:transposase